MARTTADCRTEMTTRGNENPPTLRIDDDTFEALSVTGQSAHGDDLRILRWVEAWSGRDR